VEVKDMFERYRENLYTIGLECLLLSKAQFIFDMPKEKAEELKEHGQDYRVLPYPYYAKDKIIVGMEEKDMKDACAVFLDHAIGRGVREIDCQKIKKVLKKDKRFALTVRLNFQNIVERQGTLRKWMTKSEASTVVDRVIALLKDLPKIDKRWDKPWWNTAVETPVS
jgi:hypothetical protein